MMIEQITAEIISRGGGHVNGIDDPGGPTIFGVTLVTARQHHRDKIGDGRVREEDEKRLTKTDTKRIILHAFFRKPKIDKLSKALQTHPRKQRFSTWKISYRLLSWPVRFCLLSLKSNVAQGWKFWTIWLRMGAN